jgi:hypothetical protein
MIPILMIWWKAGLRAMESSAIYYEDDEPFEVGWLHMEDYHAG